MRSKIVGLLAVAFSLGFAQAASAADMPTKAPIVTAPVATLYNWSGIYVGGSVGWAHTDADWAYTNPIPATIVPFSMSDDTAIYGGYVGVQYQWSQIVVGIEGALNGLSADADNVNCGPNPTLAGSTCRVHIRQIDTIGGKLGWAGWDNWLLYAQGGYAWANIDSTVFTTATGVLFDTTSNHHHGWYVGAGVDYVLYRLAAADVIIGVDYQHIELQATHDPSPVDAFATAGQNARDIKASEDVVRAKLTLKFNPFSH